MQVTTVDNLDRIASRVDAAMKSAKVAAMFLDLPPDPARLAEARRQVLTADENATLALSALTSQGATIKPGAIPAGDLPLSAMDTPANRALLAALDLAVAAAEKVDAERGRVSPARLSESDTLGTDLAEWINQIRARVYLEIHGAKGKGQE